MEVSNHEQEKNIIHDNRRNRQDNSIPAHKNRGRERILPDNSQGIHTGTEKIPQTGSKENTKGDRTRGGRNGITGEGRDCVVPHKPSCVKLNLGCGSKPAHSFFNCDIRKTKGVDVVCDVRHLPFKTSSVDHISASDVLEHVGRLECTATLMEWRKVLKQGKTLWLKVPDLSKIASYILMRTIHNGYEAARLLYAEQDYPENLHRNGFTQQTLHTELTRAGFTDVAVSQMHGHDFNNMEALAVKP